MKVKVKAIKKYNDLQLKKIVKSDAEFEVEDERAKQLVDAGVAVLITEAPAEPEAATEPAAPVEPEENTAAKSSRGRKRDEQTG